MFISLKAVQSLASFQLWRGIILLGYEWRLQLYLRLGSDLRIDKTFNM